MSLLAATALLAATQLAPGVFLIPGQLERGRSPDGNTLLFRGSEGWLVIDTGRGGAHTDALISFLSESDAPPKAVLDTHWHLDHIGGNAKLRRRFPSAPIAAHPAIDRALAGFHAKSREQIENMLPTVEEPALKERLETELALLRLGRELSADQAVTESGPMLLAGRELDLHVETRAVSDGDVWLFDPETRILVSGDLVTLPVPLFDTACPEGWQEALGRIADVDFDRLVPGHGEPMTRARFLSYREAFDALLACAASRSDNEACIEGWLTDAGVEDSVYARELLDYYLTGSLRPGAKGRETWCKPAP